jgi:thiamine kinase-like enzyme
MCHRDAHRDNFLVDGAKALLIDFELACWVDPARPCYDLIGPASGVEVPEQHTFLRMTEGIWWDSSAERKTMLWREFGHLAGLKGPKTGRS